MFTAYLVDASKEISESGVWSYSIVFTDGVSVKYAKNYDARKLDDDTIRASAAAELNRLNDGVSGKRTIQVGSAIDLVAPVVTKPDPAEVARQDFFDKLCRLRGFQNAAALGLIPADYPAIAETLKSMVWDDSYAESV